MDNVKLVNCKLLDTDLAFEYCKNIDASVIDEVVSIKNPISGKISAKKIDKMILDNDLIDKTKTDIEVE